MGQFKNNLIIKCLPEEESRFRYKVFIPFKYKTGNGELIVVPVDFKTDFASIPWLFRKIFPTTGRFNEATVIHDYLCFLSNKGLYSRQEADNVFFEAMKDLGVRKYRSFIMFNGVRLYTYFLKLRGKTIYGN